MSVTKQKSARVKLLENPKLWAFLQHEIMIKVSSLLDKFRRWRRQGKIPELIPIPKTPEVKMPWPAKTKVKSGLGDHRLS